MGDNKYISISEFAKIAKVSNQAVYQRLNKDLSSYLKVVEGKKKIDISALDLFIKQEPLKQVEQGVDNSLTSTLNDTIETLRSQLEIKDSQIAEKDKQINNLMNLNENQQKLLLNQQNQNTLMLESTTDTGFFSRLFNKRDKNIVS